MNHIIGLCWWVRFYRYLIPAALRYHAGRLYYWRYAPTWVLQAMLDWPEDAMTENVLAMQVEARRELSLRKDSL